MYYQEKWIDGELYVKTTPDDPWKIKQPTLADLRDAVEYRNISIVDALDMAYALGIQHQMSQKILSTDGNDQVPFGVDAANPHFINKNMDREKMTEIILKSTPSF